MLTDRHIEMVRELLHGQLSHMGGLMSPGLPTVRQFLEMRQEFVQVLHTEGVHWVNVSTIGCKETTKSTYMTAFTMAYLPKLRSR